MLTTPESLAHRILRLIRTVNDLPNPQITLNLKRDLADYYRTLSNDAQIRYTDTDQKPKNTEYLVDFCVIADHWIDTAIESEWNPDLKEIEYDFEKLLHVKASLKVMICDSKEYVRDRLLPAAKFLRDRYRNCEAAEAYMIFNWRGNCGVANCHVWTPTETNLSEGGAIKFRCLQGFPAIVSNRVAHPNDGWLGEIELNRYDV